MPPTDHLRHLFSRLTDEELLVQLAEEQLTDEAAQLAREELASRGVNITKALSEVRAQQEQVAAQTRELLHKRSRALRRVVRFPIRALLGVESPWLVVVVGAVIVYLFYRGSVAVIGSMVLQRPLPGYALPLSYAALAIFELASLWFAVSIWRCARKGKVTPVIWLMRILGIFLVVGTLNSAVNLVPVIQQAAGVR